MLRSLVYKEDLFIGEAEIRAQNGRTGVWAREIRISHFSPASERCPPLAVLYTVAADGFCFKMEAPVPSNQSPIAAIHAACIQEKKTAVVALGNEELHLVAMPSKKNPLQYSCFWGFTIPSGLYKSCLIMLNRRCLGIVFDLDETLVVANTMRSFEDRIYNLQQKISSETDQQRLAAMMAEIKRYQQDKSILKQFIENDQVVENGKVFKVQTEVVLPLSESHQQINRPVIRLQEKDIILTRVNPAIRDTSVLVRVRPAWEELRRYLTAKGRKRFEVYVCTMAERDYAHEIWRLLDPESSLINCNEILDRVVCVKSELKKSLLSVFQDGKCHPKMSLVIDDRSTVWDSEDRPRVHVVPAFTPYHAPQVEVVSSVAVLCVARNVACSVRGGFFKEYDECLLPLIGAICYEDELSDLPAAPDVSNYLTPEEDTSVYNGNKDSLCFDGMADVEVEKRLKETNCNNQAVPFVAQGTNCNSQAIPPMVNNFSHMQMISAHNATPPPFVAAPLAAPQVTMPYSNNPFHQASGSMNPLGQPILPERSLQGSPAREEGEVNESELDPDTRRRLLILQHGQDARGPPPFELGPHLELSIPPVPSMQPPGNWLPLEEEVKQRQPSKTTKEYPSQLETTNFFERQTHRPSFFNGEVDLIPTNRVNYRNKRLSTEVYRGTDSLHRNDSRSNAFTDEHFELGQFSFFSKNPIEALQGIAAESGDKVDYKTALLNTAELQFIVEVWFMGEMIGEGIGRTRKEAQKHAAQKAIHHLANDYLNLPEPAYFRKREFAHVQQMDFPIEANLHGNSAFSRNEPPPTTSEDSVATLKDLCTLKGFSLVFKPDPSIPTGSDSKQEVYAQVEIAGQVLGKGTGITWNTAKLQASEEALANLKSMLGQFTQKCSLRSLQTATGKSWKTDCSLQDVPSPGRYSKNIVPQS